MGSKAPERKNHADHHKPWCPLCSFHVLVFYLSFPLRSPENNQTGYAPRFSDQEPKTPRGQGDLLRITAGRWQRRDPKDPNPGLLSPASQRGGLQEAHCGSRVPVPSASPQGHGWEVGWPTLSVGAAVVSLRGEEGLRNNG